MVKVTVVKVTDNWIIVKKHNIVLALSKNGYWIDLTARELAVPYWLYRRVKHLIAIARSYGLIDREPIVHKIDIDELPRIDQRVAWAIFYHYGDSEGRRAFACYVQGKDPYVNC